MSTETDNSIVTTKIAHNVSHFNENLSPLRLPNPSIKIPNSDNSTAHRRSQFNNYFSFKIICCCCSIQKISSQQNSNSELNNSSHKSIIFKNSTLIINSRIFSPNLNIRNFAINSSQNHSNNNNTKMLSPMLPNLTNRKNLDNGMFDVLGNSLNSFNLSKFVINKGKRLSSIISHSDSEPNTISSTGGDDLIWLRRNENVRGTELYNLMKSNGKGKLLDIYCEQGERALEEFLKTEIPKYLLNNGEGMMISKQELKQMTIARYSITCKDYMNPIEFCKTNKNNKHTRVINRSSKKQFFEDSYCSILPFFDEVFSDKIYVCWNHAKRGVNGETLLHLCGMQITTPHKIIAKMLLKLFPNIARDWFIGDKFFGQTALHQYIIQCDIEIVKLLVYSGVDVNQRALGHFFQSHSLSSNSCCSPYSWLKRLLNNSSETLGFNDLVENDLNYFGEYPLSFAACTGNQEIYDFLLEHGTEPNVQDYNGNTVLHMVVIHNRTSIYRFALKHYKKPADPNVMNNYGLTPITLSAKLGRRHIFMEIVDLNTQELWKYGSMVCSVYPLMKLDTIDCGGHTDWSSSLMYIINGTSDDHLDMLDGGVVRQLLSEKWRVFGYKRFIQMFLLMFFYCLVILVATTLRETKEESSLPYAQMTIKHITRYCLESIGIVVVVLLCCLHIHELKEQGVMDFIKGLVNAPLKACFLMSCFLILMCIPLRIIQIFTRSYGTDKNIVYKITRLCEEMFVIFASLLNCFYLLFFTGGIKLTGPFVTMIFKMIKGDLLRFGIIYVVGLCGFTQVFYFLFKDIPKTSIITFKTFHGSLMTLFQMTFGKFKYEEFKYTKYHQVVLLVFASFMIFVPILLLNMLIAMMGNTYQMVISRSQKEWISMWAKIVITLERTYGSKSLKKYQQEYSTLLRNKGTGLNENGIVIINSRKKTLATSRKIAIENWKRYYRKISQLIKNHKESGKSHLFLFESKEQLKISCRRQQKFFDKTYNSKNMNFLENFNFNNIMNESVKNSNHKTDDPLFNQFLHTLPTNIDSSKLTYQNSSVINSIQISRIIGTISPLRTVDTLLTKNDQIDHSNNVNIERKSMLSKDILPNPKNAFKRLNSSFVKK